MVFKLNDLPDLRGNTDRAKVRINGKFHPVILLARNKHHAVVLHRLLNGEFRYLTFHIQMNQHSR